MLIVNSTLLLLVNAVTLRRDRKLFRVAILTLLYLVVNFWTTRVGMYDGLFHSTSITHSFDLYIIGAMVLQLSAFQPRRLQEPMGPKGKKISSFFLTKYTDNSFLGCEASKLFIIYLLISFETGLGDYNLLIVPVMIYTNAEIEKSLILQENKGKAGVYR